MIGDQGLELPPDRRQSDMALRVARGVRRLLRSRGFSSLTELPLTSGRRADIVALGPEGVISIIEIKSSIADFRADGKWQDYRLHCDRLYFAIPESIPHNIMPSDAGLIVADEFEAELLREAPRHKLSGASRRALLLRFAQAAADRLHRLSDPEFERFFG